MERQQEDMKHLFLCGIIRESSKLMSQRKKIFTKIAFSLLVILTFTFSLSFGFQYLIDKKTEKQISDTQSQENPLYDYFSSPPPPPPPPPNQKPSSISDQAISWAFKVTFTLLTRLLLFFPTAAVAYVVACVYTGQGQEEFLTFRKILRFLTKVWKRLSLTFLWVAVVTYVYSTIFATLIIFFSARPDEGVVVGIIFLVYGIGLVYMTVIWELAYLVAVLEDAYGFVAMKKSNNLIKGKRWTVVGMYLILFLCIFGVAIILVLAVVAQLASHRPSVGLIIGLGVLGVLFLVVLLLFHFVMQTVLYFVCKSHHGERIDSVKLSGHLEVSEAEHSFLKMLTCCWEHSA